jgi:hypothetical protein
VRTARTKDPAIVPVHGFFGLLLLAK